MEQIVAWIPLSFILRASSDTLPTPMNLRRWKIQTSSSCRLCGCQRPTSAHILNGCPIALQQGRYTYRHDQVLLSLLVDIMEYCDDANVFADLDTYRAGNTPLATIPPSILTISYRPEGSATSHSRVQDLAIPRFLSRFAKI